MSIHYLRTPLSGLLLFALCLVSVANAALIDRGNGMIYDSTQDITWLQDANLAQTSGHHANGRMYWDDSVAWADGLSVGGFTDWRLYNADPGDTNCTENFDPGGGFSQQYFGFNCTGNELGHLFYNEFNLTANQSVASLAPGDNANFDLFINVQGSDYWSGTGYPYPPLNGYAWSFSNYRGDQDLYDTSFFRFNAWAVRDGDVAAVPEPGVLAMFGIGLLGLVVRRRQGRQRR